MSRGKLVSSMSAEYDTEATTWCSTMNSAMCNVIWLPCDLNDCKPPLTAILFVFELRRVDDFVASGDKQWA